MGSNLQHGMRVTTESLVASNFAQPQPLVIVTGNDANSEQFRKRSFHNSDAPTTQHNSKSRKNLGENLKR